MKIRVSLLTVTTFLLGLVVTDRLVQAAELPAERPNIIWIFAEDTSPWMGCYGDPVNANGTPNIDFLANSGVRFARAFVPAPVCSACRSAMMLGQNQIRFGAHEHRSGRGPQKIRLPAGRKLLPQIMKESGYFTFNLGKTDYNFEWDQDATYVQQGLKGQLNSWNVLKRNQPFFGQFQTKGGKNNTTKFPADRKVDPGTVQVPADYPQNQVYRETVAQHYDAIRKDDDHIGQILKGLEESGLDQNTIVVYFSDHGANNLVRHKQMPTEGGLHVPFVISGPQRYFPHQGVRDDLVNLLDLSATTLAWAGIDIPDWYEGRNLFADDYQPRKSVASAKDRLDHTLDRVRTVRTDRYRYTRNYKLDRILLQPQYRDSRPFLVNLRTLYADGKLPPKLKQIYFGERPSEELYDVSRDPSQLENLATDPRYQSELDWHRQLLNEWLARGDMGEGEESVAEMKFNADGKKWGEGVNPEYEIYRPDQDGDGLSDKWEEINGRDPEDGRLLFEFDCGGWQTEGWQPVGISNNLAGFLGYLEFHLDGDTGTIVRENLRAPFTDRDRSLAVRLRCSDDVLLTLRVNGRKLSAAGKIQGSGKFTVFEVPLGPRQGTPERAESLALDFQGKRGTRIEIDSIQVKRGE